MVDLQSQYKQLKAELDARVIRCIESGAFIQGPEVKSFETELGTYLDGAHVIACANGTDALQIALMALELDPGDEVIVPSFTFVASVEVIALLGLKPIVVDVDPRTFLLKIEDIEASLSPRTKAIIPVHLYGHPADMDSILAIARKHGLKVIEDCAQAHGAMYGDQHVGAIGDAGAFSFQSSKNVCAGEGGMMITNSRELWEKAWSFHNIGRVPEGGWYDHRVFGTNLRLTEFQAALILRGMQMLPEHMDRRDENAMHLRKRLDEIPGVGYQAFPPGATRSAWHLFIYNSVVSILNQNRAVRTERE